MKKTYAVALMPRDYRAFVIAARPLAALEGATYVIDANSVPHVPLCRYEADDDAEAVELFQWARPHERAVVEIRLSGFVARPYGEASEYEIGFGMEDSRAAHDIRRSLMMDLTTQSRLYCKARAREDVPLLTVATADPSAASTVIGAMKGLLGSHEWELVLGNAGASGEISSLVAIKS